MVAPVVDAGSYTVSTASDSKAYTNGTRWASTSPFTVGVSGGTSPQFRVKDPGGTWGSWRSDDLSVVGTVVSTTISIPSVSGATGGAVTESSAVTISDQGHEIQVRDTASGTAGASVSPSWVVGGQSGTWGCQTATSSRVGLLTELLFDEVGDATNPVFTTNQIVIGSTGSLGYLRLDDNPFYNRNKFYNGSAWVDGTPPAAALALPHIEFASGDHVVEGDRALRATLYPRDFENSSNPSATAVDYQLYRRNADTATARARWSSDVIARYINSGGVWHAPPYDTYRGYRRDLWFGISIWFGDDYAIDYHASSAPLAADDEIWAADGRRTGGETNCQYSSWQAGNDGSPLTIFRIKSGAEYGNRLTFSMHRITGASAPHGEPSVGHIWLPASRFKTGVQHHFVMRIRFDSRLPADGGNSYMYLWHNDNDAIDTSNNSPYLLGALTTSGLLGTHCAWENGYDETTFRTGADGYLNEGSNTNRDAFASGIKFELLRQYHSSWHNVSNYRGVLTEDNVLTIGYASVRIGDGDSGCTFSDVHPTGASQP